MSKLSRRTFVSRGFSAAAIGLCGGPPFAALSSLLRPRFVDYGPLHPARSENTGEILLALPERFRYVVFGRAGDLMSDGHATPSRHDGMGAFADGPFIRLVRNHEIFDLQSFPLGPGNRSWDRRGGGGTTTLVIDPVTRLPLRDFVSLSGTSGNCSGGITPWGTWISCEETVDGIAAGFQRRHGYCFEVAASANEPVFTAPIRQMGRFKHEAIAVDPVTGTVYLTEDAEPAGFYRFLPDIPGELSAGGRLQMLSITGAFGFDARNPLSPGSALPVTWVDIDDPDPLDAESNPEAVFHQGAARGGTTFSRLEGVSWFEGSVFFDSTDGGLLGLGQVWKYYVRPNRIRRGRAVSNPSHKGSNAKEHLIPSETSEGVLTLVYESTNIDELSGPDNICVSPRGDLIFCEDGPGESQSLRGFTRSGRVFEIARNIIDGFEKSEFTGITFSPDGETVFVNIQTLGITLAIWGPWGAVP